MEISVVVPVYNEVDNVERLYGEINRSLRALERSYEILFVDDGSRDGSLEKLRRIRETDEAVKLISFRKNFGQTAALSAGFDHAEGEVVITLYGELHRFIPAVASWMGVNIAEVKVNHRERVAGKSKYGISRVFRVLLDLITVKFLLSYSGRPIQFFGLPGLLCGLVGGLIAVYLAFQRLVLGLPIGDRPLLLLAILLIIVGIQFIVFGLLGELQIRTYHESLKKPIYFIKEKAGFD